MPTISLTEEQYATLRQLATTLFTQARNRVLIPESYQIHENTEETFKIANRTFHSDQVLAAMTFMKSYLRFSPETRKTLSALYTFDALATFGLAHGIPVVHIPPHRPDYGCWITRVEAQTYLATKAQGFCNAHVVAKHRDDAPLDPLFCWIPEMFSPVPASTAAPQTAHWSQA